MTQTVHVDTPDLGTNAEARTTPGAQPDAGARANAEAIELLGLVAYLEHEGFARLAADAALAPSVGLRLALSRFAATAVGRRDQVLDRVVALGGDPEPAFGACERVLEEFDARTSPSTWSERLLTSFVGYGVADDFCRLLAARLDDESHALVLAVLDDTEHADLAVAELAAAGSGDDVLVSRLALWGRRLGGEALGVVQSLLASHPTLLGLVPGAPGPVEGQPVADAAAAAATASGKLFNELTAQHTRRMARLGLTA